MQHEATTGSQVKINAVLREINKGTASRVGWTLKEGEALPYAYIGFAIAISATPGFTKMNLPMVAGHEAAGIVQEVGPGVTVKPGDHVASAWMCPCARSECRRVWATSAPAFPSLSAGRADGTSRMRDAKGNTVLHGNFVSGFPDYRRA
jgi:hypothetical protein